MNSKKKRQAYSPEFKAKIAILTIKEDMTVSQICSQYKIQASQISRWKAEFLDKSSEIFKIKKDPEVAEKKKEIDRLYKQIGKLTVQNEFLREKLIP